MVDGGVLVLDFQNAGHLLALLRLFWRGGTNIYPMPRTKGKPQRSLEEGDALDEMEVAFQTPTFIPNLTPPGMGQAGPAGFGGAGAGKGKGGKGKGGKGKKTR